MTTPINADAARGQFLQKLHKSELLLSEWEQSFVSSFIGAGNPSGWFTPARRVACDKMQMKFGGEPEIGMPLFAEAKAAPITEADPGCCEYLKLNESRQQVRCNAPAEWQRVNGFRYCQQCADTARQNLRRQGKIFNLVRYP